MYAASGPLAITAIKIVICACVRARVRVDTPREPWWPGPALPCN